MENIAEQIFASIKTIFEQLSFWGTCLSASNSSVERCGGMKFISIPHHKSLTETKQFTYTLHPIPKIVCNQFSKANTQCDTIMEAAGIDTTRVNAINFLFSESDNRKKEVNNKRQIHHPRQRHIDVFPPISTPNTHTAERALSKKRGSG